MIELKGKHNTAKVMTDNIDDATIKQILEVCNDQTFKDSTLRIMPDCHAGIGSVIGTTMTIHDNVVPNLVGSDIGCGMTAAVIDIRPEDIRFEVLEDVIRKHIPNGADKQDANHLHAFTKQVRVDDLHADVEKEQVLDSIGTLGGGNHFIEVNRISDAQVMLVIHSGSRALGGRIAKQYQNQAYKEAVDNKADHRRIIDQLKREGREKEIEATLQALPKKKVQKELAAAYGDTMRNYLHDMRITQHFADVNRRAMIDTILRHMNWVSRDIFTTVHNYIDFDDMVLRKGAISAYKDERVLIPLNMEHGSIIGRGKGNPDWNYSGPHGAGRIYSRSKAKENITLEAFEKSMADVWTKSVHASTIDESSFAYKPPEDILRYVEPAVDVDNVLPPLYNFKASE